MESGTKFGLTLFALAVGAVAAFGLAVYPFHYGLRESVVVGVVIFAALVLETVLDEATFGA